MAKSRRAPACLGRDPWTVAERLRCIITRIILPAKYSLRLLVLAGLAASMVAVQRLPAQDSEPLKKRLLVEMPEAWERYRAYAQKLQGRLKLTQRWQNVKTGKRVEDRAEYEVKRNKNCASWLVQSLGETRSDGLVVAVNPKYAFQIKRSRPGGDWLVAGVDVGGNGASFRGEPAERLVEDIVGIGYMVERVPLSDLLTQGKEHKLVRVTGVRRQGVDAVQLEFDSSHPVGRLPFSPVQGGTVLLDPANSWHILEYNLRGEWGDGKGVITMTVAYGRLDGAMGIPRVVHHSVHNHSNPALESERVYEFDLQEPNPPPPDREFTLSAYGLPEPPGLGNRPTRWYLWAAGLGFVCLGLSLLLRWRARRTASAATK